MDKALICTWDVHTQNVTTWPGIEILQSSRRHSVILCSRNLHSSHFVSSPLKWRLSIASWSSKPPDYAVNGIMFLTARATERGQKLQELFWLFGFQSFCCFFLYFLSDAWPQLHSWAVTFVLVVCYKPAHAYWDASGATKTSFNRASLFSSSLLQNLFFCRYWSNL